MSEGVISGVSVGVLLGITVSVGDTVAVLVGDTPIGVALTVTDVLPTPAVLMALTLKS